MAKGDLDSLGRPIKPMELIVKLGKEHNNFYLCLPEYYGTRDVREVLVAVDEKLEALYGENRVRDFDHVEVLQARYYYGK